MVFAVDRDWFPTSGYEHLGDGFGPWFHNLVLPWIAMGVWSAASLSRQLRSELIDVLDTSYVRTAWAKGGRARLVVGKHALKNAAIPAITVVGLQVGYLLGGTLVIEQIFAIPGLGSYLLGAVGPGDLPVIQGVVLVYVLMQVLLSLVVDLSYGLLNPKVRVQ